VWSSPFSTVAFRQGPELPPRTARRRAGFTLFELLAVITIVGIVLAVTLGSFQGWGDAHAVRGSAELVEAALAQARDYAVAQRAPVSFEYQTSVDSTNGIKKVSQFWLLRESSVAAATNQTALASARELPEPLGVIQRLPGGAWLLRAVPLQSDVDDTADRIVFLPSGRALNPTPGREPRLFVVSRKLRGSTEVPQIVYQLDVSTADGSVSAIKLNPEEITP
jgi:prepilin-type N-terminal cleavage/methylation domain-containing protein